MVAYQRHRHCRQHRHSFLLFSFGLDCLLIVDVALAADVADVAFVALTFVIRTILQIPLFILCRPANNAM